MVGTSDVCSMDQCAGSLSSIHFAAGPDTFGSGLSTSRYRCACSGGTSVASCLKYEPVVSLTRSGGVHCVTLPTASVRSDTAFDCCGTEPCPAGPFAISSTA